MLSSFSNYLSRLRLTAGKLVLYKRWQSWNNFIVLLKDERLSWIPCIMQATLLVSQATGYTEASAQPCDTSSTNMWTLVDSDFTLITEGCLRSRGAIESIRICTTPVGGRSRHLLFFIAHATYYKRRTQIRWHNRFLPSLVKLERRLLAR